MEKSLLFIAILLGLVSIAMATAGTATYYNPPYTPSSCYGNANEGTMIVAASDAVWANRAACGRMYTSKCTGANNEAPYPCTGRTVRVKVVDHCSICNGTFNLSRDVFLKVSTNLDVGNIKIAYNRV